MSDFNQRLFSNSFYLALMQIANLGLPLITFPYLVRVLGIELVGVLALATAVMHYANVLIDYGFNLTATRQVAQYHGDSVLISAIYCRVQIIKLGLSVCCVLILGGAHCFNVLSDQYFSLYFIVLMGVICSSLFPVWVFQGMEKMRTISMLSLVSKVLFTVGVFVFVDAKGDYLFVPILTLGGALITLVVGSYIAWRQFQLAFVKPTFNELCAQLRESWYVFLSQLKITLFSNTNVVILGVLAGPVSVGYYAGAEKLMRALAHLQTPVTQALFPQISQLMRENSPLAFARLDRIAKVGSSFYILLLSMAYLLSDVVCLFMFDDEGAEIASLLRWMLPIPLCIFLNNIFGTQILLNIGCDKAFFWGLLCVAIFSLFASSIMAALWQHLGATLALLATEMLLVVVFFVLVKVNKKLI